MRFFRPIALVIAAISALSLSGLADDAASTAYSDGGDAVTGKRVYNRCRACHLLTEEGKRMGPTLYKLFGRQAGTVDGYKYSKAMQEADFVWTEQKLNEWLMAPRTFLPGNKMAFAGLRKEQERKDLMAFLRQATTE